MLKNYRSESNAHFDKIQKALATHGANKMSFDYAANGHITGIEFALTVNGQVVFVKLPAKIENVALVMYKNEYLSLDEKRQSQVYRTTWANIKDWIEAQMAMIDTNMVKIEEVFLPYVVLGNGQTVFERMQETKFTALGSGTGK